MFSFQLDILISNAAAMGQYGLWEEAPISTDKALFDLNVFSLVNLNRIVLNYFKNERGRQGHLAVVSSLAGKMGFPYLTPYTPTKFALHVSKHVKLACSRVRILAIY